ncbi:MAG: sulfate adenylyltransferase [Haloferacaceae archaeon]
MIAPHGNELVDRYLSPTREERVRAEFDSYPTVRLDDEALFDLVNLATGRYSPLTGFLTRNDFHKVVEDMTLESGVGWTLPITLDVGAATAEAIEPGERLGLETPDGDPAGYVAVDDVYRYSADDTAAALFGTTDRDHPGVRQVAAREPFLVGGDVGVFEGVDAPVGKNCLTPAETRVLFDHRGWETVVGFQTRNAPHRGHEYIQKSALERTDGIFIHPKLGKKKPGDYTDRAILDGYDALVEHYYPSDAVVTSPFPSRMLYAGPREAVFDAIVRKNHGCTHFIIGRDHAGVGDYYDDFAAQQLFADLPGLGIEPMFFPYAFYCERCDGMASERVCPHADARIEPSGTRIRNTLKRGERPPGELMRPEVAERITRSAQTFVE